MKTLCNDGPIVLARRSLQVVANLLQTDEKIVRSIHACAYSVSNVGGDVASFMTSKLLDNRNCTTSFPRESATFPPQRGLFAWKSPAIIGIRQ